MWSTEVFLKDRWLQAAELRASPQGLEHLKPCAWLSGHYMGTAACILKSKPEAQPSSGISPSTGAGTPEHPNRPRLSCKSAKPQAANPPSRHVVREELHAKTVCRGCYRVLPSSTEQS